MIVQRGYKQPPSFHEERLRSMPPGYFFQVMTNGFVTMPSYALQVQPEDRWAIAAYVKALQLSRHVDATELTADERAKLDNPEPEPAAEGEGEHGGHAAAGSHAGAEGAHAPSEQGSHGEAEQGSHGKEAHGE
jgi:hypothetical protein